MATLVIRKVKDDLHTHLKAQAMAHRRSMEEEARMLLRQGVATAPLQARPRFGQAMRAMFQPLGGLDLPAMRPEPPPAPLDFSGPGWDPVG